MDKIRKEIRQHIWVIAHENNSSECQESATDQIISLIPQWKTFSETEKPEVGDLLWLQTKDGRFNPRRWKKVDSTEYMNSWWQDCNGCKFFIIPKNQ